MIVAICKYCLDPIYQTQQSEPAYGKDQVGADPDGWVHSGSCAKQWKLKVTA